MLIKIKHIHSDATHTSHILRSRHRLRIRHIRVDTAPALPLMPSDAKPLSLSLQHHSPGDHPETVTPHIDPPTPIFMPHPPQSLTRTSGQLPTPNKMTGFCSSSGIAPLRRKVPPRCGLVRSLAQVIGLQAQLCPPEGDKDPVNQGLHVGSRGNVVSGWEPSDSPQGGLKSCGCQPPVSPAWYYRHL